jgi:hypothetical protein
LILENYFTSMSREEILNSGGGNFGYVASQMAKQACLFSGHSECHVIPLALFQSRAQRIQADF